MLQRTHKGDMAIMRHSPSFQRLIRPLVEYRFLLSLGLSAASGVFLNTLFPIDTENRLLTLIALERPPIFHGLVWSYDFFLYSTPFLMFSMFFSLLYVHLYRTEFELAAGSLPSYPNPRTRTDLSLVVGEVHRQLVPLPSSTPQWLTIPERGLYTGIASFGSIGSGKTYGLILPAMRQLFAYRASDPARKLSGIVLEVKGDLCRQLQRILEWCGREQDYVEVSLDGNVRYNPLNNSLDAYAQAFNIASIITSIWGKGKEPFWQQSYTDLVRYVIMLHRIRDGYLTMVDLFRSVISAGKLEEMLTEVGSRFSTTSYIGIGKDEYHAHEALLSPLGFEWNKDADLYVIAWTDALENLLTRETSATLDVFTRKLYRPEQRDRFDSIQYWYWEHWKFFRSEVKTSIIQASSRDQLKFYFPVSDNFVKKPFCIFDKL